MTSTFAEMRIGIVTCLAVALAGCGNSTNQAKDQASRGWSDVATETHAYYQRCQLRSHPFQPLLFVAEPEIPDLQESEWSEIITAVDKRGDYAFDSGIRESIDFVAVHLGKRSLPDEWPIEHLMLVFKRIDHHWVEEPALCVRTIIQKKT